MMTQHGVSLLAALRGAGRFAQSIDVLEAVQGLSAADFSAYISNTNPFEATDALLGDVLFPSDDQDNLDFSYLVGGSNAAVLADVTSHLGEAPIVGRRLPGTRRGAIPAIKQKRLLDAETLIRLQGAQGNAAIGRAVQEIFDDTTAVRRAVRSTIELLRMQALAFGIVTFDWVGVTGTGFDYGVPANQKATLAGAQLWSDPTSDPIKDLNDWQNVLIGARGNPAGVIIGSTRVVYSLTNHPKIRTAIHGVNSDRIVTLGQVNQLMGALELPLFIRYDRVGRRLNTAGVEVAVRFYPDDRITMIGGNAGAPVPVGRTLRAPTAEEATRDMVPGRIAIDPDRVAVHTYLASQDPKGLMTLGTASAFPTLEGAEDMFQAKVL